MFIGHPGFARRSSSKGPFPSVPIGVFLTSRNGRATPPQKSELLNHLLGGFQIAVTYEYQPGPLINWGNLFYHGNLSDIAKKDKSIDRWFNTDNFERVSSKMPAAYHRRVFPTRIEGVRADNLDQWNANIQRGFKLSEGVSFQLRLDALNLLNATQFAGPNVNPASTDFGRVSSQTNTTKRFIQLQARIRF